MSKAAAPACAGLLALCAAATVAAAGAEVATRPLPPPRLQGSVSVEQALQQRRSVRTFTSAPLALRDLGQLLWAAQGVTDARGLRTVPSAGGLMPLQAWVLVLRVEGLAPGLYRYEPASQVLAAAGGSGHRAGLAAAVPGQAGMLDAPAVLLLTGDVARTAARYGVRAPRYVHVEAGAAAQNVYLQATALGLATVLVGAFDDQRLQAGLALPAGQAPLALMPVGHAAVVRAPAGQPTRSAR
ncbi:MAG: nitroreductase [Leptothrix sp. (in: Bacteria)]|nr:nitroreductase [Leptothrix sp. (in: b-proteobacteria)]